MKLLSKFITATAFVAAGNASATELDVMHWWTSGGEAAAVAEFAKAFDATGNTWVDAAIVGGEAARAAMVSRILGGEPMGAFQFNHGRQAEELIESGLLRDITDIAEAEGWKDMVNPSSLLDACTVDGRIYCAPVNIHSWQWLWVSHKAFEDSGVAVPTNWTEFVAGAAALEAAGKVPLAMGQQGWQQSGAFNVMMASLLPNDIFMAVYGDKDASVAAGPEAFEDSGVAVPTNWTEFVAGAAALEAAGKVPLAMGQQGWQQSGAFNVMMASLLPNDIFMAVYGDKDAAVAAGPEVTSLFEAAENARSMAAKSTVQNWNDATNLVITGQAGGQIMGDWAQGEFAVANAVAGEDYSCLPGLGMNPRLGTGGDAFYFPVLKDDAKIAAQGELAALLLKPTTQVAFNLKKGSLPVRGDVDLSAANDCMQKGLALLDQGALLPDTNMLLTPDTANQMNTLFTEFFADTSISAADAQADFVKMIANAD